MAFIVYAVYKGAEVQAAGSLLDCWKFLLNTYGEHFMDTGFSSGRDYAAVDLAEAGVHIAPVGDHYKCPRCGGDKCGYVENLTGQRQLICIGENNNIAAKAQS